ncbi:alpha/beta fold hydrolase [Amycolatopsis sp. NPDC051372]|uniref:alpha/beta fold hydrolase n=1 Tax=Amycolatopsis sp. NPDC051372 TaxID=3155669 RepID=UPI00343AA3DD
MTVLHHRADGAGGAHPLILGPSLGTTLSSWEPQTSALARGRQVIRYDLPGHGGSPAELLPVEATVGDIAGLVLALADHLGIARFAYAGTSLGGPSARGSPSTIPTASPRSCSSPRRLTSASLTAGTNARASSEPRASLPSRIPSPTGGSPRPSWPIPPPRRWSPACGPPTPRPTPRAAKHWLRSTSVPSCPGSPHPRW